MAKKKKLLKSVRKTDITSWNFIIFLTLAFMLLVTVVVAMQRVTTDIRSRAGLSCPEVQLPRAEDCPTGWVYKRDIKNGCLTFICENPSPTSIAK